MPLKSRLQQTAPALQRSSLGTHAVHLRHRAAPGNSERRDAVRSSEQEDSEHEENGRGIRGRPEARPRAAEITATVTWRVGLSAEAAEARTSSTVTFGLSARGGSPRVFRRDRTREDHMATGTVKWFNEENGYGYIAPDAGGKDLFVHRGSIIGDWRSRTLPEGTRVGFDLRERSEEHTSELQSPYV